VAIRYPKDKIPDSPFPIPHSPLELGKAQILREGKDVTIIALGSMVLPSLLAVEILAGDGIEPTVINSRFAKPLDIELFKSMPRKTKLIFTVEEGILEGGFGSAVSEAIEEPVARMGLPAEFIAHGKREILLEKYGLTPQGIAKRIVEEIRLRSRMK
jgi:1-deoxy-D-xylulose-5-phosphate synthase